MTGYSQYPLNTRWMVFENADTVLDPLWGYCNGNQIPFISDRCDLTTKKIIGCKSNTTYKAKVCYNNGNVWSPYSDSIVFTTLPEPSMQGSDTIFIVLWGHSLIHLGDLCDTKTTIRLGEDSTFLRDNIAHMLQTELKRITNKNIKVINKGQFGSLQYNWFRSDSLHKYYLPGGAFENTAKYKYALFFFGSNDCNANYPSPSYGDDIRWIIDFMLSKNVKVVFNSIHHTTSRNYANQDSQVVYRNVWNNVMSEYSGNTNVIKGLDFYNLFQDTVRYMLNDGIHCNLSEGMPQVVRLLAEILQNMINVSNVEGQVPEKFSLGQNFPNPFNPVTKILFDVPPGINGQGRRVRITVYDIEGRVVETLVNELLVPKTYEVTFDGRNRPSGVYFYQLSSEGIVLSNKMLLIK